MTVAELDAALRAVEPSVRLVSARHLLRLLVYLRDHGRPVPLSPEPPFWTTAGELRDADVSVPDAGPAVVLVTRPADRGLDDLPDADLVRAYWRLLYRAAVDRHFADVPPGEAAGRLVALGPAAAREIRYVLEADHLLDPAADPAAALRAFAASYLDLRAFDPQAVADHFPSLPPADEVDRVLANPERERGGDQTPSLALGVRLSQGVALLAGTKPRGASDPVVPADDAGRTPEPAGPPAEPAADLVARAAAADRRNNWVRAAILHTQAGGGPSKRHRGGAPQVAHASLAKLVDALARVCDWDAPAARDWGQALAPLLAPAARGTWPRAARCLYELQKVPAELTAEVSAVDLIEWARTLGRRPVVRPLPRARDVRLLAHLRAARAQLLRAGLPPGPLARLDRLFEAEMHRVEHRIRASLTPVVTAALDASGFRPAHRVEAVGRDKLVAELLDRVCERGYLRIGDLRDAVARNRLKMPDLAGPVEWVRGDPLLRADARLAEDLDGVYRRGEAYLRGLQRGSSLFFGTRPGRFLTLYLIGPFLAAFLVLMTIEEFRHLGGKAAAFVGKILAPTADDRLVNIDPGEAAAVLAAGATSSAAEGHHGLHLVTPESVVGLGLVLLLVFHVPVVRRGVVVMATGLFTAVRRVVWDLPRAAWRSPVVRAVRYSRPVRLVGRWLVGPAGVTAAVVLGLWLLGASPGRLLRWGGAVFGLALVALNTPWGRVVQEVVSDRLADGWRLVRVNLLPGLVTLLLDRFARLANWFERRLYAVDEWFRYREGDSRPSLVLKAALGLVWFPLAYLVRFAFNLLVEPQINPVKHFPVVTVSHKVILPMAPGLAEALNVSDATSLTILGCIPGVFGFIAWELMANWRLYAANRPPRLAPVTVGSHGETVRGLLRPGFHSGTVPKLFRHLREASRAGRAGRAARARHELDHVGEAVGRFVDRELSALLRNRPGWDGLGLAVSGVRFGCQRVVVGVRPDTPPPRPMPVTRWSWRSPTATGRCRPRSSGSAGPRPSRRPSGRTFWRPSAGCSTWPGRSPPTARPPA